MLSSAASELQSAAMLGDWVCSEIPCRFAVETTEFWRGAFVRVGVAVPIALGGNETAQLLLFSLELGRMSVKIKTLISINHDAQPRISLSFMERSSLAYSLRAALSRCFIITG